MPMPEIGYLPLPRPQDRCTRLSQPMNYLITGGAGFIGSHLADVLLARGDTVVAFDHARRTVQVIALPGRKSDSTVAPKK